MSPASKSKSKDKKAIGKDQQKSSNKTTSNANTGVPSSGYNPLLGTFHTLDTAPPVSIAPPIHINGRSRNFDDTEEHSAGMGVEYDSASNNGSWSGESEDHKEKTSQGSSIQETISSTVDNDKREKIRLKNEKKHQRQKERRAQELHERCSGYLMSRKLESLAQQLVAMGFSSERATMALILNKGSVEQSVAWLFDSGEDADNQREPSLDSGNNLKIDISEELAKISEMEIRFKCSKQEVERAIVSCEGDLEQAAETLKVQKHEQPPAAPPKLETNGGLSTSVATSQNSLTSRTQSNSVPHKTDVKDLNYTKSGVLVGPSLTDTGIKSLQLLKKVPSNSDWTKQPQAASNPSVDKRWPVSASGANPYLSQSLASPLQAAPPPANKIESRYPNIGTELKNLQLGSMREPVIVMQRPKSKNIPPGLSSSLSALADWHPNAVDPVMNMNISNNGFSHGPTSTRSLNTPGYGNSMNTQSYDQFHYQQQQPQYASGSVPFDHHYTHQGPMSNFNNGSSWNRMVGPPLTPTLSASSSLGLFSGLHAKGSSVPSSSVDWNSCDSVKFDYTNIDWSLDRLPHPSSSSPKPNGMWTGFGPSTNSTELYAQGRNVDGGKTAFRPPNGILSNMNHGPSMGLHPAGVGAVGSEASAGGSRDWSSPFEEKELFGFPRHFVSPPSL